MKVRWYQVVVILIFLLLGLLCLFIGLDSCHKAVPVPVVTTEIQRSVVTETLPVSTTTLPALPAKVETTTSTVYYPVQVILMF